MAVENNIATGNTPDQISFGRLVKSVGSYSIATILQRVISVVLLPLYTHYLRPSDYAVLELLDLVGSVTSLLLGVRLGQAVFYYYFHAESERERGGYISTAFFGSTVIGVLPMICGFPFAAPLSRWVFGASGYAPLLRIFLIGLAGSFPVEIGLCYLRVRDRSRDYNLLATLRIVTSLALNVALLAWFKLGAAAILWSTVISNVVLAACLAWSLFSEVKPAFTRRQLRDMVIYSLPLGLSGLGEFLLHFGDRFFLRPNISLNALGIYSFSYKVGMMVAYASGPFYTYWNSQMVGIVKMPRGNLIYARTATYVLLGLSFVAVGLTVFARPLLALGAAPDYAPAAAFIPWIALAYVIRAMGSYFLNTFLLEKRPAVIAHLTWLAAGICVGGYVLLVPHYRAWGAIAATLVGFSTALVLGFWKSQRVRPFPYEYRRWFKIVLASVVSVVTYEVVQPNGFWRQVGIASAATLLFPIVLLLTGFADPGERQTVVRAANIVRRLATRRA